MLEFRLLLEKFLRGLPRHITWAFDVFLPKLVEIGLGALMVPMRCFFIDLFFQRA